MENLLCYPGSLPPQHDASKLVPDLWRSGDAASEGRAMPQAVAAFFWGMSQPKPAAKVPDSLGHFERSVSMCDYSLHAVATRSAEVGETLVSTKFRSTTTRGFAGPDNPEVAVCLRPGTEIAFDSDVQTDGMVFRRNIGDRLARFRQLDLERP